MSKFHFFLFIIIINVSCSTNYFRSAQQNTESDSTSLPKIKLGKPLDSIEMYLFGDYHKFRKDKKNIWITNKEFKKLLHYKLSQKPHYQVLFTFNSQPHFSNIFGFYYEGLDLRNVKERFQNTNYYQTQSGMTYFYPFGKYKISDSFLEKGNGVLRIITLNNPFYENDKLKTHYNKEINQILFQLNEYLFQEFEQKNILYSTPYGNYLRYVNAQIDTSSLGKQIKATALSFIGDFETRDMMIANLFQYQIRKPFEIEDEFQPRDAKEFILNQTQNQDVVMFNENHMNPQNRIFFASMLEDFKKRGFEAIAFEALTEEDSAFVNGVPTLKSGFYTPEPEFGNLLREAINLGFEIHSYESRIESDLKGMKQMNFRDSVQAENLKKIYNKKKKLLVYAGHGHIEEKQRNEWKTMAQRFYEITNVNPLTIEQDIFSDLGTASRRNNVSTKITAPSVLVNSENKIWTVSDGFFDIQVFFPQTDEWIKVGRRTYTFQFQNGLQGNIIQVYHADDEIFTNPIPVAIQEIKPNQNVELILPDKRKYKLFVLTEYGQVLQEEINFE